jgi:hypothetical protein
VMGVTAGLMQGGPGVFAERIQKRYLQSGYKRGICGYSVSAFSNLVSMLIMILVAIRSS